MDREKEQVRRFNLQRSQDVSGVSGTGVVAEGVEFDDGTCVMRWKTTTSSTAVYHSAVELLHIHGHEGATRIEWVDEPEDSDKLRKLLAEACGVIAGLVGQQAMPDDWFEEPLAKFEQAVGLTPEDRRD